VVLAGMVTEEYRMESPKWDPRHVWTILLSIEGAAIHGHGLVFSDEASWTRLLVEGILVGGKEPSPSSPCTHLRASHAKTPAPFERINLPFVRTLVIVKFQDGTVTVIVLTVITV
jgi:hypothetical protein